MARLYIDLDGVLADFDAAFPIVFGRDHKAMDDDDMWATINTNPSFFRDLPPCPGALDFFHNVARLYAPIILTACNKSDYAGIARQKRAWVREHLGNETPMLPVLGGTNKPLFMHDDGDVLIDDFPKNIAAWNAAGGAGILHTDFTSTTGAFLDHAPHLRAASPCP